MAKECYYLRHKIDQELFIYLEFDETWEKSFLMEFRINEVEPHFIKTGVMYENRNILLAFRSIGLMSFVEASKDKKIEWRAVTPDNHLEFSAKNFLDAFQL